MEDAMDIGVLGSGDVGQVLASGLLKHGHQVMIGTRDPLKLASWAEANPHGQVGSFADVAKFGDVLVLAVQGAAAAEVLAAAGPPALDGKVVIDATNPIGGPPQNGVLKFYTNLDESLMERLQGQC